MSKVSHVHSQNLLNLQQTSREKSVGELSNTDDSKLNAPKFKDIVQSIESGNASAESEGSSQSLEKPKFYLTDNSGESGNILPENLKSNLINLGIDPSLLEGLDSLSEEQLSKLQNILDQLDSILSNGSGANELNLQSNTEVEKEVEALLEQLGAILPNSRTEGLKLSIDEILKTKGTSAVPDEVFAEQNRISFKNDGALKNPFATFLGDLKSADFDLKGANSFNASPFKMDIQKWETLTGDKFSISGQEPTAKAISEDLKNIIGNKLSSLNTENAISNRLSESFISANQSSSSNDLLHNAMAKTASTGSVFSLEGNADSQGKAKDAVLNTPLALHTKNWQSDFSQKINWMMQGKLDRAEIHIDPKELGPLIIRVSQSNGEVQVNVQSNHSQTRELFEMNQERLKDMLEQQGIQLSQFDVQSENHQEKETSDSELANNDSIETGDLESTIETEPTLVTNWQSGRLDFFV
ncbi:flagellar hook-length control protein FliK [Pleionea sediminis]|uniref:flagellar hook-length control protein FliK n=1 Tax=Pleionea sediminis TaxID=2569479 RepID=UPI0013DD8E18|nr:flagellar hook-length control protein FliK [Pleionea sediminis]